MAAITPTEARSIRQSRGPSHVDARRSDLDDRIHTLVTETDWSARSTVTVDVRAYPEDAIDTAEADWSAAGWDIRRVYDGKLRISEGA